MAVRECDNDNCEWEPYTDSEGRSRARWRHVPECVGPQEFDMSGEVPTGSFLEYLLGRKG